MWTQKPKFDNHKKTNFSKMISTKNAEVAFLFNSYWTFIFSTRRLSRTLLDVTDHFHSVSMYISQHWYLRRNSSKKIGFIYKQLERKNNAHSDDSLIHSSAEHRRLLMKQEATGWERLVILGVAFFPRNSADYKSCLVFHNFENNNDFPRGQLQT